jgi:hypothetical protein
MVAFTPGFITCDSSNVGTIRDVAGKSLFKFEKKIAFIIQFRTY